ncbi:bifunctional diguanylate cyclase/phosphodiesterase [Belnapia moabensis]|uniref:bifunctional diguanylate cyclase/phosphodiesterase n=1 Tax=Belnapia moabensis TaxID=365533 RepID=UPI0005BA87C7|nr:EAL domain-containing protein [Belnapia moabensis]
MFRILACVVTEHDLRLVLAAALICMLSATLSVTLLGQQPAATRLATSYGRAIMAAIALGGGAWATHFVAMLAYDPGLPTAFAVVPTLGSAFTVVAAVAVGILVWRRAQGATGRALGGAIVGLGIGAMHYMGMAAIQLPGRIAYDWGLVAISVLLGASVMAASFARWTGAGSPRRRILAAAGIVAGIVLLHFTGMGAVEILPEGGSDFVGSGLDHGRLAILVVAGAGFGLSLGAVALWTEARARAGGLRTEAMRLRGLADAGLDGLVLCAADGTIVEVNTRFCGWAGRERQALLGLDICSLIQPQPAGGANALQGVPGAARRAMLRGTAGDVPVEIVRGEIDTAEGRRAVLAVRDLRERLRTEARFEAALTNMPHGLAMFDDEARLLVANTRYAEMYRLPPELVRPGTSLPDILAHHVAAAVCSRGLEDRVASHLPSLSKSGAAYEVRDLVDGRTIAISRRQMARGGWISVHEDVTERRRTEAQIAHLARHDALTGLPNRMLFRERLEGALTRVRRGGRCAILYLDLDRFKEVNDTLGHPLGDALLQTVATRLNAELRECDTLARLGGDEFAIVQTDIEHPQDAKTLARRLISAIERPFELDGHQVVIGTSVGIAIGPGDGLDPDILLKAADMALYRAKAEGRGRLRFFEAEMDARMQMRRTLELELRRALAAGEFELYYQPIVEVATRRVCGLEALVRWNHPDRGLVPPDQFIPLCEEIGLIIPLGEWVLTRACAEATGWAGAPKVAVNLSPAQFASRGLVDSVAAALAASGLEPRRLELEITETVMLRDTETTLVTLHRLKALGVRIAMDDFGTGYSSLSYLQRFPFDKVKIDRSFVKDLNRSRQSNAIITAVADLCYGLDMATTAEGVETEEQFLALHRKGCGEAQGYLFSKPRPGADIPDLLARLDQAADAEAS